MRLRPLFDRITVERVEATGLMGTIIIPSNAKEPTDIGVVVAVGTGKPKTILEQVEEYKAVCSISTVHFELQPTAFQVTVGDRILFSKYAGNDIEIEGRKLLVMHENEVLGIFEEEPVVTEKSCS